MTWTNPQGSDRLAVFMYLVDDMIRSRNFISIDSSKICYKMIKWFGLPFCHSLFCGDMQLPELKISEHSLVHKKKLNISTENKHYASAGIQSIPIFQPHKRCRHVNKQTKMYYTPQLFVCHRDVTHVFRTKKTHMKIRNRLRRWTPLLFNPSLLKTMKTTNGTK